MLIIQKIYRKKHFHFVTERSRVGNRAGSKFNLYICIYEVPGGLKSHREQIARELISVYKPSCNTDQYDQSWRSEWIGEYQAPTTGPLTTDRDPNQ